MTAYSVPNPVPHGGGHRRRHREDAQLEVWFMTGERSGRHGHRKSRRGMHGPAGFGGFGGPLGPGRRAGRGDMRAAILALLAEEPMHGYQIIQVISERSGGNWTPSPGSVYPTLQQLEDEGLIEPAASESGRRVFTLTQAGKEAQTADTTPAPWEGAADGADNDLVELRDLVHQVLAATRQVAQAGTQTQIKGAQDVLRTARKSIYKLLAEDE
jgi:DNA-binding PadR family transcriptional regulator